jgi:heterodisulfide reductase subunit A-like polyferredoxin
MFKTIIALQLFIPLMLATILQSCKINTLSPEVLIIGGGTSGVSAGITSAFPTINICLIGQLKEMITSRT